VQAGKPQPNGKQFVQKMTTGAVYPISIFRINNLAQGRSCKGVKYINPQNIALKGISLGGISCFVFRSTQDGGLSVTKNAKSMSLFNKELGGLAGLTSDFWAETRKK
jgi:hypothetical protein